MPLLLLDLDDTIADREAAFLVWARAVSQQWAPDDTDAVAFLVVGAHRAGIASIWLHCGRTWTREDLRPDRVADDLAGALAIVAAA